MNMRMQFPTSRFFAGVFTISLVSLLLSGCGQSAGTSNLPSGGQSTGTGSPSNSTNSANAQTSSGNTTANSTGNSTAAGTGNSTVAGTDSAGNSTASNGTESAAQKKLDTEYKEGYSAFFAHDYTKAISLEDEVIKQSPTYYQAYNVKGIALSYNGNFSAGMQNIEKSLKLHPGYGYGQFNKSLSLELYGYYDQAIQSYQETIKIAPAPWVMWSYYGIASIYGRRGDVKDTVYYLKQAIALNPSLIKGHARTEKDFDNVRGSKEFQDLIQ